MQLTNRAKDVLDAALGTDEARAAINVLCSARPLCQWLEAAKSEVQILQIKLNVCPHNLSIVSLILITEPYGEGTGPKCPPCKCESQIRPYCLKV